MEEILRFEGVILQLIFNLNSVKMNSKQQMIENEHHHPKQVVNNKIKKKSAINNVEIGIYKQINEWNSNQSRIMVDLHDKFGNQWGEIAKFLPGRTDRNVKNHFYGCVRKSISGINSLIRKYESNNLKRFNLGIARTIIDKMQVFHRGGGAKGQDLADQALRAKHYIFEFCNACEDDYNDIIRKKLYETVSLITQFLNRQENNKQKNGVNASQENSQSQISSNSLSCQKKASDKQFVDLECKPKNIDELNFQGINPGSSQKQQSKNFFDLQLSIENQFGDIIFDDRLNDLLSQF